MLFSSLEFLYLFLPITCLVYFFVPSKFRNIVLLVFSLIFYGWGEPIYVFLMVFTIVIDYIAGFLIDKYRENKELSKKILISSIVINLLLLGFFKYFDFLLENVIYIFKLKNISKLGLSLPIGISFYTFQSLSYVIDVYRGECNVQKNILNFGTYVTLFPQLIAGPIVKYRDVDKELTERHESIEEISSGLRIFICGLCKKVLLANSAGALWENTKQVPFDELTTLGAWLGIIMFTMQIYFDFSGYSDMAIGLGKIFGFHFCENFNYPYISKSITEFWRRWHISLSSWFKEYVYIPLGGNRCKESRMYFNLFIVWMLTGIWHGASWNYLIWGIYYFLILFIEKAFLGKYLSKLPNVLQHIYALFFIVIGWLIFAFEDSANGLEYLKVMIGINGSGLANKLDLYEILRNLIFFAIMVIASLPKPKNLYKKFMEKYNIGYYIINALCILGFILCTAYLVDSSYNPFLYFRF